MRRDADDPGVETALSLTLLHKPAALCAFLLVARLLSSSTLWYRCSNDFFGVPVPAYSHRRSAASDIVGCGVDGTDRDMPRPPLGAYSILHS